MEQNPVEATFVGRFIVGLAVVFGMFATGGAVGALLQSTAVPYGDWVGVGLGAIAFFVAFVVAYRRYDASFDPQ